MRKGKDPEPDPDPCLWLMDCTFFRNSESTAERGRPGGPYHQGGHLGGQPGPHVLGLGSLSLTCWAWNTVLFSLWYCDPHTYCIPECNLVIYAVRLAEYYSNKVPIYSTICGTYMCSMTQRALNGLWRARLSHCRINWFFTHTPPLPPIPSVSSTATHWERETTCWRDKALSRPCPCRGWRGWVRSRIIRQQENLVLYK